MLLRFIFASNFLWALAAPLSAIDYGDTAAVRDAPELDLGNLFAWPSSDRSRLNIILSLAPVSDEASEVWSLTGKYRIHIDRDNDLREDIGFDFYFSQNRELAVTTGPESLRGVTGRVLQNTSWRTMAGTAENFVHGDFDGLKQFFTARFPCRPTTEKGLRCGSGSAEGSPQDSAQSQKLGFIAIELDAGKFSIAADARINVWASAWKAK